MEEFGNGTDNCSEPGLSNRSCFAFSKDHFKSVIWTKTGVSILAATACCLAVLLIIFFKAHRRFVHRLTLYLAIVAFIYSVIFALQILPVKDHCGYVVVRQEGLCTALGFLVEYSAWVMLLFMCWITLHIFMLAVLKRNYKSKKYEAGGVIACHVGPLLFSVIPFINFKNGTMYGLAGAWCWIRVTSEDCHPYPEGTTEQFVLWYGPLIFLVALSFVGMLVMIVVLYRGTREGPGVFSASYQLQKQYKEAIKEAKPLLFYPIAFNVICCLAFANRVYYAATRKTYFTLWVAHAVADPCLPLFIPVAFLLHPYTLRKLNCGQFRKAAKKWQWPPSQRSRTHFIVSKEDSCDTSDEQRNIIVGGAEGTTSGYQSFLDINT